LDSGPEKRDAASISAGTTFHPSEIARPMPIDKPLCPATKGAIATLANRLRTLQCDNSLVAMHLHRIARDLEALADGHATLDCCGCKDCSGDALPVAAGGVAAPIIWSAQECGE
jgi:hypothetical protein